MSAILFIAAGDAALKVLFGLFWQLCLFRRGPQDVPYSPVLLVMLVGALIGLGCGLILWLDQGYLQQNVMGSLAALTAWFVIVYAILALKQSTSRMVQTMTACLGTDLIVSLVSVPLRVPLAYLEPEHLLSSLLRVALLVVMIWDILIKSRIYEAAMGLGRLQANLLSVTIWLCVFLVNISFLPPEAFTPPASSEVQETTLPN